MPDPARADDAEYRPSWNVAPTDPLPVLRSDARDHQRSLDVMRWGLMPFWAKDINPSDDMVCWPVSPRVGNVRNNDRNLIEPIAVVG